MAKLSIFQHCYIAAQHEAGSVVNFCLIVLLYVFFFSSLCSQILAHVTPGPMTRSNWSDVAELRRLLFQANALSTEIIDSRMRRAMGCVNEWKSLLNS